MEPRGNTVRLYLDTNVISYAALSPVREIRREKCETSRDLLE